ncbi:hypothetical protein HMPREF1254_1325 [Prevotella sp. BV3P1]|nr:hypothetical protein HMPREF1254_1325 [Prevotella sp. BV3P1]
MAQVVDFFYQITPQKRHFLSFNIEKINRQTGCKQGDNWG